MRIAVPRPLEPDRIRAVASRLEVALPGTAAADLCGFGELFLTWNQRINLGGAISADELTERHFLDSFAAARLIPRDARVADVGSGGGLPALPLALVRPDLHVDMFEPTGKKVAFIRTAIRELGLKARVTVHPERVVQAASRGPLVDVAMSRATLAPPDWLVLGRTMIAPTGAVLVFATKGPGPAEEPPRRSLPYAADRCLLEYGP